MSQEEITQRLQELKNYKLMILEEMKEAKMVLMLSNSALESVGVEQEILKKMLEEIQEVN